MSKKKISSQYIPQSKYRTSESKSFKTIDTNIPTLGSNNPHKKIIKQTISDIVSLIHQIVTNSTKGNPSLITNITKKYFAKPINAKNTADDHWECIEHQTINTIKTHYLSTHIDTLLITFNDRLMFLINKYKYHLPHHISKLEGDDLTSIAQLELIETFKTWNPSINNDLWPLAYTRINGAMKDHIRYITKSDPTRFYDWVTDAAYLFISLNNDNDHNITIETSSELERALNVLTPKEKQVVISYVSHDQTLNSIAKSMNLSESQISRIYKKALEKIKKLLT